MVLAFWVGKKTQSVPNTMWRMRRGRFPVEPVVYTPENGVKAEWFASAKASATVIVLNGVTAIPDSHGFFRNRLRAGGP